MEPNFDIAFLRAFKQEMAGFVVAAVAVVVEVEVVSLATGTIISVGHPRQYVRLKGFLYSKRVSLNIASFVRLDFFVHFENIVVVVVFGFAFTFAFVLAFAIF